MILADQQVALLVVHRTLEEPEWRRVPSTHHFEISILIYFTTVCGVICIDTIRTFSPYA